MPESSPGISLKSDPIWHEAIWLVAASLNDRIRAQASALLPLKELFERDSRLSRTLLANERNTVVTRVASYYAFLHAPDIKQAETILRRVDASAEELKYGRALWPWLQAVAWIISHARTSDLIELTASRIDLVQMTWPTTMTSKGEFATACQATIQNEIRPWVALAALARDADEIFQRLDAGAPRTLMLREIAEKMQKVRVEVINQGELLRDRNAGWRLIAYSRAVSSPSAVLVDPLVDALIEREDENFGQYWALLAIEAAIKAGGEIKELQQESLKQFGRKWASDSDRRAVLNRIVNASPIAAAPTSWILVVGQEHQPFSPVQLMVSQFLGEALAKAGYGLIADNRPGIGRIVAETFANHHRRQKVNPNSAMRYPAPDSELAGSAVPSGSAAVIMIGDSHESIDSHDPIEVVRSAFRAGVPVFPLASTGEGARMAFLEMVNQKSLAPDDVLGSVISSKEDAERVVDEVILRLRRIDSDLAAHRSAAYIAFRNSPSAELVPALFSAIPKEIENFGHMGSMQPLLDLLDTISFALMSSDLSSDLTSEHVKQLAALNLVWTPAEHLELGKRFASLRRRVQNLGDLVLLVSEYNQVRQSPNFGSDPLTDGNSIVKGMREIAKKSSGEDTETFLLDSDGGRRLAAYCFLIEKPDSKHLESLTDALVRLEDTAFGQYWGIRALELVLPLQPPGKAPPEVPARLDDLLAKVKQADDSYRLLQYVLSQWREPRRAD